MSDFERPAPDPAKLLAAWEDWERGEASPGATLASLKTAGMDVVLHTLAAEATADDGSAIAQDVASAAE